MERVRSMLIQTKLLKTLQAEILHEVSYSIKKNCLSKKPEEEVSDGGFTNLEKHQLEVGFSNLDDIPELVDTGDFMERSEDHKTLQQGQDS